MRTRQIDQSNFSDGSIVSMCYCFEQSTNISEMNVLARKPLRCGWFGYGFRTGFENKRFAICIMTTCGRGIQAFNFWFGKMKMSILINKDDWLRLSHFIHPFEAKTKLSKVLIKNNHLIAIAVMLLYRKNNIFDNWFQFIWDMAAYDKLLKYALNIPFTILHIYTPSRPSSTLVV